MGPLGRRTTRPSRSSSSGHYGDLNFLEPFVLSMAFELLHPMKTVLIAGLFWFVAFGAYATDIVYDPINHGTVIADHIVDFAKWAKTEADAAQTQLNTLETYENTVLQVARFGNPAALRNIPGVSTIAELYQIYGQLSQDVAKAEALMSPENYQANLNSILSSYQLPNWNGYTTASGLPVLPGQGMFQFPVSSYNLANNAEQQFQTLDQQRQKLQQRRDTALSSLQGATTASDVQKYDAVVKALNASIAEVSQAEQELTHRTNLQNLQLNAGHQIYTASQTEAQAAAIYQAADQELQTLPSNSFHTTVAFPQ